MKNIFSHTTDFVNKKAVIVSGLSVAFTVYLYFNLRKEAERRRLREAIAKRQSERADQIKKVADTLAAADKEEAEKREAILALTFTELIGNVGNLRIYQFWFSFDIFQRKYQNKIFNFI